MKEIFIEPGYWLPRQVRVVIEMSCDDWSKIKKSVRWRHLLKEVDQAENKSIQMYRQWAESQAAMRASNKNDSETHKQGMGNDCIDNHCHQKKMKCWLCRLVRRIY